MRTKETKQNPQTEPEHVAYTVRSVIDRLSKSFVPLRGEPIYCVDSKEFLVGDGETPVSLLNAIDNIVTAADGRLYTVSIDSFGNPVQVIPLLQPVNCDGTDFFLGLRAPTPMSVVSAN